MALSSLRRLARVASLVGALAVSVAGLTACDGTPPGSDAFYTPPSPLPAGAPGDVIRSRSSVFSLDPVGHAAVPGVTATQVLYRSTDATGDAIAVSGTVLVPTTPWLGLGSRPLVTYAVGTRGLGDSCAPSFTLSNGSDYEGLFVKSLLDRGWAVAVTDYEGLGTPGQHTYVIGQSEGRAVLDMARAAQRLPGTGLSGSTPVGIFGYSQGGGAAVWAAQLQPSYAPTMNVKGIAAGGVPADLTAVAEGLDGGPFVGLELLASIGLDAAYPELHLSDYLNDTGRQLLDEADDLCLVSFDGIATIFKTVFHRRSDYTSSDPLATPAWKARLAENKAGSVKPTAPAYLFHGAIDEMVPFEQAAAFRRAWCDKGANVTWSVGPGEHVLTMAGGIAPAGDFLAARFAGLPTLGNCWLP